MDKTDKLEEACKWCAEGDKPHFLDSDGTLVSITGENGILCHAHEEYWWPCLKFGVELHCSRASVAAPPHPFGSCGCKFCDWPDGELRCNEVRTVAAPVDAETHSEAQILLRSWVVCMRNPRPSDWENIVTNLIADTEEYCARPAPSLSSEAIKVYADGYCARCSELSYPLTKALEKTGVPTGADNRQQTYGPNKVRALADLETCLRQLLFALEDGKPEKIKERTQQATHYIEFHAAVRRRLTAVAEGREPEPEPVHPSSEAIRAAAAEIVKAWLWQTHEHDQERAKINIAAILSKWLGSAAVGEQKSVRTQEFVPTTDLLDDLQRRLFDECVTANWDPERKNTFAEEIAHLHEELSEAFRAWRRYKDCKIREMDGKLEGVPIEFADALIGMFYNAELYGFDLLEAVERKHEFNLKRNYVAEGRQLHAAATPTSTEDK